MPTKPIKLITKFLINEYATSQSEFIPLRFRKKISFLKQTSDRLGKFWDYKYLTILVNKILF